MIMVINELIYGGGHRGIARACCLLQQKGLKPVF
jgi:hypothetical protein